MLVVVAAVVEKLLACLTIVDSQLVVEALTQMMTTMKLLLNDDQVEELQVNLGLQGLRSQVSQVVALTCSPTL